MGTPLRNISAILSPKFLSPMTGKHLYAPCSEGKKILENHHKGVKRRLHFSKQENSSKNPIFKNLNQSIVPIIKVEHFEHETAGKTKEILEINTPNKKDLLKSGLDNFRCRTDILGKGKFGTVFKALYQGVPVAVKLVKYSTQLREENSLFLDHKNIVNCIEIIKNSTQNFSLVLMEYLPHCKDLQYVLENSNVTNLIKKFTIDITRGLSFCHQNGVLHLDLKPKNILVDGFVCKICDFGNSLRVGDDPQVFGNNGTAIYTAPELLLGKPPTTKCDIYSLGVIFGQMKYGKTPFDGIDNLECIIYNVGKRNLKPFSNLASQAVDCFTELIKECLGTKPETRPDTREILKKIETIVVC